MFRLVVLEELHLLYCWGCSIIKPPEGQNFFQLLTLLRENLGLASVAVLLDYIKDMFGIGVRITTIACLDYRHPH
jgi:hypothetical protein